MLQPYGALRRYDRHVGDAEAGGRRLRRAGDLSPPVAGESIGSCIKDPCCCRSSVNSYRRTIQFAFEFSVCAR